jgi:small conductance mechanosensitive channel
MNLSNAAMLTGNALSAVNVLLVNEGLSIVAGILILIVGWILATWAKRLTAQGLAHVPLDLTLKPLIASLTRYVILIFTVILVLGQFGVQTTSLIALLGAAGLAVGLALQGTLSNVAAGVMLLVLRPFRVGHFVQAGGQSGTVREIGLFTTIMTTRDLVYVSVPNSAVWSGTIVNYTREPLRRVAFDVPVDFVNDLDRVEKTMLAALQSNMYVLKAPEPWAGVADLKECAVIVGVNCCIRSEDYWRALPSIRKSVKTALDEADVLLAVSRQAPVVRNEPRTRWNAVTASEPSDSRPEAAERNPARRSRA